MTVTLWLVTVWQWCHAKTITPVPRIEDKRKEKDNQKESQKKLRSKLCKSDITPPSRFLLLEELVLSPHIVLSFPFYFSQFFSNFFKYSFSNFLLSYSYNIFAVYFTGNSPLLKFFSSAIFNFSYLLTSAFILLSNSATTFFVLSKSSSFFQLSCSTVNLFHHTKYFTTLLTFLLFDIFPTSHFSSLSTSTSFTSSLFCFSLAHYIILFD